MEGGRQVGSRQVEPWVPRFRRWVRRGTRMTCLFALFAVCAARRRWIFLERNSLGYGSVWTSYANDPARGKSMIQIKKRLLIFAAEI